jgi:hypothetical protein
MISLVLGAATTHHAIRNTLATINSLKTVRSLSQVAYIQHHARDEQEDVHGEVGACTEAERDLEQRSTSEQDA